MADGTSLVEVYDADGATSPRLINVSTRSNVGTGADVQIADFVIDGAAPKRVLIRASGPALAKAPFNIGTALADPVVAVYRSGQLLYSNVGWGNGGTLFASITLTAYDLLTTRRAMNSLRLAFAIAVLGSSALARTVVVGNDIHVTTPQSWEMFVTKQAMNLPTVAVQPADGRDARLLMTLFPPLSKVADLAALRDMFQAGTQNMQPPGAVFAPAQLATAQGKGYWATFEDPELKGKPIQKDNYKLATAVFLLMKNGEILQATLLTNTNDSSEFKEGFAIVKSATVVPESERPKSDPTKPIVFRAPGLPVAIHLPAGFVETPTSRVQAPNYFMADGGKATIVSGWIEPARKYHGFAEFWKGEKETLIKHDMPPTMERVTKIAGWDAVVYVIDAGEKMKIKNLRACRVTSGCWIDVHISIPRPDATWKELENALQSVTVQPE